MRQNQFPPPQSANSHPPVGPPPQQATPALPKTEPQVFGHNR